MQTLLSLGRNPFFLGREEVLARLRRQFQAGQAKAFSQPQAICGLGGVGKTQVALEYAYRHAQDYQAIFWTRADSRDTLVAGFLEIASVLGLPERHEPDQHVAIAAVKGWLSQNTGWLLILDNADDLALLPEFLPSSLSGHLLLTTRAQALGGLADRIETRDAGPGRRCTAAPAARRAARPGCFACPGRARRLAGGGAARPGTRVLAPGAGPGGGVPGRDALRPLAVPGTLPKSSRPTCCVTAGEWPWTIPTRSPPPGRSRLP